MGYFGLKLSGICQNWDICIIFVIVGWASSQQAGTQNLLHQELEIEIKENSKIFALFGQQHVSNLLGPFSSCIILFLTIKYYILYNKN